MIYVASGFNYYFSTLQGGMSSYNNTTAVSAVCLTSSFDIVCKYSGIFFLFDPKLFYQ